MTIAVVVLTGHNFAEVELIKANGFDYSGTTFKPHTENVIHINEGESLMIYEEEYS